MSPITSPLVGSTIRTRNWSSTTTILVRSLSPGEDFGSRSTATPPVTLLRSNLVQPGQSYSFDGQTGAIAAAGTQPNANFAPPTVYRADPNVELSQPTGVAIGPLDGQTGNDIILSEGIGNIGWLLNQGGTGTFPATAQILQAGAHPAGVALGYFQDNTDPTGQARQDAAVANDTPSAGGLPTLQALRPVLSPRLGLITLRITTSNTRWRLRGEGSSREVDRTAQTTTSSR